MPPKNRPIGRTTKRIREEQKGKKLTLYESLQRDLIFMGFCAIKEVVVEELKTKQGVMPCILCGHDLHFTIASNNHLHVKCSREGCIKAME